MVGQSWLPGYLLVKCKACWAMFFCFFVQFKAENDALSVMNPYIQDAFKKSGKKCDYLNWSCGPIVESVYLLYCRNDGFSTFAYSLLTGHIKGFLLHDISSTCVWYWYHSRMWCNIRQASELKDLKHLAPPLKLHAFYRLCTTQLQTYR